jgi:nucleoid-associated protein YgaU
MGMLQVEWFKPPPNGKKFEDFKFQFNPTELSYDKSAEIAEITIPGLDAPLQQFIRGHAEKLTLELFFDSTDKGMGQNAVSVTEKTDPFYRLIKIEPERHAPPICVFFWNEQFPGSSLSKKSDSSERDQNSTGSNTDDGNQRRNGFRCIVESVKQKFTLFSPEGVPLRATLTVTLREYKTLKEQLDQLNPTSPDRTHSHVLQSGDTLSSIAAQFYQHPGDWRFIADTNGIEDPRRLTVGSFLTIPPTR